jgi:hypothetical protein
MNICAIPIRTLFDFKDCEKAASVLASLLLERGFDLSRPYSMMRDAALGVYLFRQPKAEASPSSC